MHTLVLVKNITRIKHRGLVLLFILDILFKLS